MRRRIVRADEATARAAEYLQTVTGTRLWTLARTYWFDALILAFLGVGLAEVVVTQGDKDGPAGPLWFDILAVLGITLPLFARRRFPFGAPVTSGVVFAAARSSTTGCSRAA